jgi:hypothetical protein
LTSLQGLENLKSIGGSLYILYNFFLTSLQGLENLRLIGSNLGIYDNVELCTSDAEAFADQVLDARGIGGDIYIEDNKDCAP